MPDEDVPIDDDLADLLDRVRDQFALASQEQALEMLLKRRMRKGVRRVTGRGPALHAVGPRS